VTRENRAEQSNAGEPRSPYGITGQRVGELAQMLQGRLASAHKELPYAPGERPRWDDDDRLVFGYVLELEDSLAALEQELQVRDIQREFSSVTVYEMHLPYAHHMWDWIKAKRDAAWEVTPDEAYELVKRGGSFPYEELIMRRWKPIEGGTYDAYKMGAEWPEWRRGLGGQSDPWLLISAEEALDELGREMLPSE
jgi:hypothetical protein